MLSPILSLEADENRVIIFFDNSSPKRDVAGPGELDGVVSVVEHGLSEARGVAYQVAWHGIDFHAELDAFCLPASQ
jgi:hypothetical protein